MSLPKQFCTYEQAKNLKDLGFKESCFMQWEMINGHPKLGKSSISCYGYTNTDRAIKVAAPLVNQAIKFFIDAYGISCSLRKEYAFKSDKLEFYWIIEDSDNNLLYRTKFIECYYKSQLDCITKTLNIVNKL